MLFLHSFAHRSLIPQSQRRPDFRPAQIMGDNVIILNTKNIVLTGMKWTHKKYIWSTGYASAMAEW